MSSAPIAPEETAAAASAAVEASENPSELSAAGQPTGPPTGPAAAVHILKKILGSSAHASSLSAADTATAKAALSWAEELDTRWSAPKFSDGAPLAKTLSNAPDLPADMIGDMLVLDFDLKRVTSLEGVGTALALPRVARAIFNHYDFMSTLKTDPATFIQWSCAIAAAYRPSNPYHNQVHAADVMLTSNSYVIAAGIGEKLSPMERALLLVGAIIHDVGHPGRMNPYLAQTEPELALTYRHAPGLLEAFHAETGLAITRRQGQNILAGLDGDEYKAAHKTIVDLVLATDLSQQGIVLGQWKGRKDAETGAYDLDLDASPDDRMLVMKMIIKAADVSNPAKSLAVYRDWTDAIMTEFYAQGDEERDLGMPVSAMPQCDRTKPQLAGGQIGFIMFVVKPIFAGLVDYFPSLQATIDNLDSNTEFWKAIKGREDISEEGLCIPSDLPDFVWSYPDW
jgi:hypothetical protein